MIHRLERERTLMKCSCGFFVDMLGEGNTMQRISDHVNKHRPNVILVDSKKEAAEWN